MKKLISLILSGMLIFSVSGCKHKEEVVEEPKNEIVVQEEQTENLEVLEQEYIAMIELVDHVLNVLTNEDLGVMDAIKLLNYIEKNRIEPTQELTIQFDYCMDELLEVGIKYFTASEQDKVEFEERIYQIITEMEGICVEIENKLNMLETTEV